MIHKSWNNGKLYESFVKNLLNDKEKYEKYYNISMDLITDNNIENKNIDFTNYDYKILNETDEYKYIIVSANDENKGNIINMSLNACLIFGYSRKEIIGKNINILIPELYHKLHNKLFNEITEKTKTEFFEILSKKLVYIPDFLELSVYGRNKSKYLIPLDFTSFFVQTEESELVYVIKFICKDKFHNDLNDNNNDNNNKNLYCCILTDNNFIIQTFTSNCVELLGLNTNTINSNYDITSFIKGFNEELQVMINNDKEFSDMSEIRSNDDSYKDVSSNNNINDKSFEQIKKYKKKLIRTKYLHPRKIIWRIKKDNQKSEFQSDIIKSQISLFAPKESKIKSSNKDIETNKKNFKNNLSKIFIMEIKKANISGIHIGYYFYLKRIEFNNETRINNLNSSKVVYASPIHKPNLKKSSFKYINLNEESAKSSRISNDEDYNSFFRKNSIEKMINEKKKRNSIVTFEYENKNINLLKKNVSAKI